MLYKVDFTLSIWRWLFQPIYTRIEQGAISSGDNPEIARIRLSSLLINDPKFILLVNTKEENPSDINAHCLIQLVPLSDNKVQAFVEQLYTDSGHDTEFTQACTQYIETILTQYFFITEIAMFTDENKYRAFKKRYSFNVRKVLMYKEIKKDENLEPLELE